MVSREALIAAVSVRPALWDPNHVAHGDRLMNRIAWQEIAGELKMKEDELKGKWKNMRDYYKKEVKRLEKFHPEGVSSNQSQWSYFSQMSFLKESIAAKEKKTTCLPQDEDESSDHLLYAKPETLEFDTEEMIEEAENLLTNPLTSVSHTIKRKLDDEREEPESKKCSVTMESNEDEDLLFFKSLLPDFKSLSRDTRLVLKLEYMLLLHNKVNSKANTL